MLVTVERAGRQKVTTGKDLPHFPVAEQFVSPHELSEHFGISEKTLRKWAESGKIPSVSISNGARRYFRFRISAVEKALTTTLEPRPKA